MIANGENSAGGLGITEKTGNELFEIGVDVITTGNHVYRHREAYEFLDRSDRVVRPANYPAGNPGRGATTVEAAGMRVAVAQPQRRRAAPGCPLAVRRGRRRSSPSSKATADAVVVDFHAEVTSEKVAMGWHLDGRVAACLGTHTHVPTADARVLPGGTAFISDVGMTGLARRCDRGAARAGAGVVPHPDAGQVRHRRRGRLDRRAWSVEVRDDGLADSIEQVLIPAPG